MAPPLLTLLDIHISFGSAPLLEGAGLNVKTRDRLCIVGRNGSGKSTLLKLAAALLEPDGGTRFVKPGVSVRYLEQEPDLSAYDDVEAYVATGLSPGEDDYRVTHLLGELGLTGADSPEKMSGGELRRAALVQALVSEPDILLLDEPTNHLDLPAIEWLETRLQQSRSALVLISHDRRFLENLSTRTLWVDRGDTRLLDKGFAHFEQWRDELMDVEERDRHKLDRKIARETHWLIHGVSGRRKRNVRRLGDLYKLRDQRLLLADRSRRAEEKAALELHEASSSGKLVVRCENIAKAWGDNTVIKDFSCKINRGDRVGIVGPNGAGKTTLVKLITGEINPDAGNVRRGTKLEMVSLDQKRAALAPGALLKDVLTGGGSDMVAVGDQQRHVISYMKDFLFLPEQAATPVSSLSGGERGRLMLARAFARPSNLLVLDEPTNDLDLETLDLLQELLGDYKGTVFLVSHDRDFLDRVVTSVIAHEGTGSWREYPGGYSDMLRQKGGAARSKKAGKKPGASDIKSNQPQRKQGRQNRLSYKDKYALETIPGKIEELETAMTRLQSKLEDPAFFQKDASRFNETAKHLKQLETDRDGLEEEWLRLEILREDIENA